MNTSPVQSNFLFALTAVLLLAISGCTWVKATPAGDQVRLVPADRVSDCRRIGGVTTYTKDKISVVNRKQEKVEKELVTLAKNDAAKRGADTIVAVTTEKDGQQDFNLYRCL